MASSTARDNDMAGVQAETKAAIGPLFEKLEKAMRSLFENKERIHSWDLNEQVHELIIGLRAEQAQLVDRIDEIFYEHRRRAAGDHPHLDSIKDEDHLGVPSDDNDDLASEWVRLVESHGHPAGQPSSVDGHIHMEDWTWEMDAGLSECGIPADDAGGQDARLSRDPALPIWPISLPRRDVLRRQQGRPAALAPGAGSPTTPPTSGHPEARRAIVAPAPINNGEATQQGWCWSPGSPQDPGLGEQDPKISLRSREYSMSPIQTLGMSYSQVGTYGLDAWYQGDLEAL